MNRGISRRTWLTSMPALGGLLLTGCSRETFLPPKVRGGLIGAADVLTMSTNRLLLQRQQLAREFSRADVADPFPTWNQTNPRNEEYQAHASEGFRNWRLPVEGLVARPLSLSLDEIRGLPSRTQITAHVCEQGWSAIGEWTGAPLAAVAGGRWRRHVTGALRRRPDMGPVVRELRPVRGRASADDPGLRTQRARPAARERRTAAPAGRTPVRIQEPQVRPVDSGRRFDRRLWQGYRRHQLGFRVPLVRWRVVMMLEPMPSPRFVPRVPSGRYGTAVRLRCAGTRPRPRTGGLG